MCTDGLARAGGIHDLAWSNLLKSILHLFRIRTMCQVLRQDLLPVGPLLDTPLARAHEPKSRPPCLVPRLYDQAVLGGPEILPQIENCIFRWQSSM
jgi:hypothetical protein